MTITTIDPWAPPDPAQARLEHKARVKAAEERQRIYIDALRAEWNALTPEERDDHWDGEAGPYFTDLPEFWTWGNRKDAA